MIESFLFKPLWGLPAYQSASRLDICETEGLYNIKAAFPLTSVYILIRLPNLTLRARHKLSGYKNLEFKFCCKDTGIKISTVCFIRYRCEIVFSLKKIPITKSKNIILIISYYPSRGKPELIRYKYTEKYLSSCS